MIVCAAVPSLWRAVMDHRVLDYYDGNFELVHTRTTRDPIR
ncbi:hypothetical protein G418_22189 [Rhodococcus qingshengii BKS 20-40]|nr:hypothetical protein G418_22189 [Rhodococcus qingshengii BKS 20-40]